MTRRTLQYKAMSRALSTAPIGGGFGYPEDDGWSVRSEVSEEREAPQPVLPRLLAAVGVCVTLAAGFVLLTEVLLDGARAGTGPWMVFLTATVCAGTLATTCIVGPVADPSQRRACIGASVGTALVLGINCVVYWPIRVAIAGRADNLRPRFLTPAAAVH